jgi:hypothetical protein
MMDVVVLGCGPIRTGKGAAAPFIGVHILGEIWLAGDGRGKAQWLGVQEGKSAIFVGGGGGVIAFIFRPGGLNRTIRPVSSTENMTIKRRKTGFRLKRLRDGVAAWFL